VGTETLICGKSAVGVKAKVAVNVWVGVRDGDSRVDVNVGSCDVGDIVTDKAASTNPATTVCAAAVLIDPESWIVIAGKAHAITTIDRMKTVRETRLEYDIAPPNKFQVSYV
jgi:hypothetical protein